MHAIRIGGTGRKASTIITFSIFGGWKIHRKSIEIHFGHAMAIGDARYGHGVDGHGVDGRGMDGRGMDGHGMDGRGVDFRGAYCV